MTAAPDGRDPFVPGPFGPMRGVARCRNFPLRQDFADALGYMAEEPDNMPIELRRTTNSPLVTGAIVGSKTPLRQEVSKPRSHRINVEAALDAAMRQFWRHGYAATSIHDLEAAMELPRQSIYNRFGSKCQLFLQVLDHYEAKMQEDVLEPMLAGPSPRKAVLDLFGRIASEVSEDGIRDGCLTVNTALEVAPHDEKVAARIHNSLTGLEELLLDFVVRGQQAGEIDPIHSPREAASSLLSLFLGLRVLARSRPDEELLSSVAAQAGALMSPPSVKVGPPNSSTDTNA